MNRPHRTGEVPAARWTLFALLAILALVALLRLRLLDVPLERDEGEYAYAGQLLLRGIVPFAQAYNMKMPGIYGAYALILALFGQTIRGIHLGFLVVCLGNVALLFAVVRRLSDPVTGLMAAATLGILALGQALVGTAAHATHFVILCALAGFLVLLSAEEKDRPALHALSGFLFGLAFIMKQHGVFLALFAFLFLMWSRGRRPGSAAGPARPAAPGGNPSFRPALDASSLRRGALFAAGVMVPFALVCLVMLTVGVFRTFWFWTFDYASKYVSEVTPAQGMKHLADTTAEIVGRKWPIWALAAIGLLAPLWDRRTRKQAWLRGGFLACSFLATCPGLYFRAHYFVLVLPAVAWLAAVGVRSVAGGLPGSWPAPVRRWAPAALVSLALLGAIYDGRKYLFQMSPDQISRDTYGLNPFPEAVEIGRYLKEHTTPDERIAVLGSEPEIYFYAQRHAATGHVYTYALLENQPFAHRMQQQMIDEIEAAKPRFLVFVLVPTSWGARKESDLTLLNWFNQVAVKQYREVGWADIISMSQTRYVWGAEADGYKPKSTFWVSVLERR